MAKTRLRLEKEFGINISKEQDKKLGELVNKFQTDPSTIIKLILKKNANAFVDNKLVGVTKVAVTRKKTTLKKKLVTG